MQINELKEKLEQGEAIENLVLVLPYLPFVEKKIMVDRIVDACINIDENGIYTVDNFNKKLMTDLVIIGNYTDLEFSENTLEDYDYLVKNKVVNHVINNMDVDELDFIYDLIHVELKQKVEIGNSLSNVLAVNLQKLVEKIPTDKQLKGLSKSLVKDLNKFDWNKIPELKDIFKTVNGGKAK